jgi:hypothetical protein
LVPFFCKIFVAQGVWSDESMVLSNKIAGTIFETKCHYLVLSVKCYFFAKTFLTLSDFARQNQIFFQKFKLGVSCS